MKNCVFLSIGIEQSEYVGESGIVIFLYMPLEN